LRARVLALLLLASLAPPARGEDGVSVRATLHLRYTATENLPREDVLFDRAAKTFSVDGYLVPEGSERYGSTFAAFALDGRHLGGDLRWTLALDTGELRRQRFPGLAPVCFTRDLPTPTATGLDVVGSGHCRLVGPVFQVQETRLGEPELTSNGRSIRDELDHTLFVREAYAAYSFGRAGFATIRAGRRRIAVADGFVYDDYATGVEAAADLGALGPPFELSAALFQPTRDFPRKVDGISPMLVLRADWLPSLFEHAGIFAAFLRDRTGSMGEVLRSTIVERLAGALDGLPEGTAAYRVTARSLARTLGSPVTSDASLGWLGTSGSLAPWRGQRLSFTGALLGGTLHRVDVLAPVTDFPLAKDVSLRGRMASLRWESDLGERLTAGAFFLYLSGDELPRSPPGAPFQPLTGTYRGFLGVAPFITTTNLFFGGGLSESFASRQATAPGLNGRGVIAPGGTLTWDPVRAVTVAAKGAWLRADAAGPFGGRVYGTELDLNLSWAPAEWLLLGAELDALFPGDFFAGRDTLYKGIVALDLLTP
jgi:hypothetical protein